jgi:hypothetical protein
MRLWIADLEKHGAWSIGDGVNGERLRAQTARERRDWREEENHHCFES